jgi:hypothetical protein
MAENVVKLNQSDVDNIISEYSAQRKTLDALTVEFSGINELDPLVLLRVMSSKSPTVDDLVPICETMLDGRVITFKLDGAEIYHPVAYNRGKGSALHMLYADAPYLYDFLQQTIYALLLKKLTPHLESSN